MNWDAYWSMPWWVVAGSMLAAFAVAMFLLGLIGLAVAEGFDAIG